MRQIAYREDLEGTDPRMMVGSFTERSQTGRWQGQSRDERLPEPPRFTRPGTPPTALECQSIDRAMGFEAFRRLLRAGATGRPTSRRQGDVARDPGARWPGAGP